MVVELAQGDAPRAIILPPPQPTPTSAAAFSQGVQAGPGPVGVPVRGSTSPSRTPSETHWWRTFCCHSWAMQTKCPPGL